METEKLKSKNFNPYFSKILSRRKKRNIVRISYDLENLSYDKKREFVACKMKDLENCCVIYKILFWDDLSKIKNILNGYNFQKIVIDRKYKGKITPGVLYLENDSLNIKFMNQIINLHFNFDVASKDKFIQMKLYIALSYNDTTRLFYFYDDRGFYEYVLMDKTQGS